MWARDFLNVRGQREARVQAGTVPWRPQVGKAEAPRRASKVSGEEAEGFLTTSPQAAARKRQTFPGPFQTRGATADLSPGSPRTPPRGSSGASALPLRSPSPEPSGRVATPASGTPPPAQTWGLAGQAGRGQGWGSGNPLPALDSRRRPEPRAAANKAPMELGARPPGS